jgi:hypothetical protein
MYIVKKSEGSWDDYFEKDIFITIDEQLAIDYCNKGNNLLPKIKEFYDEIDNAIDNLEEGDELNRYKKLWFKYRDLADINKFFYKQIEVR